LYTLNHSKYFLIFLVVVYAKYPDIIEEDKTLAREIFLELLLEKFFAEFIPVNIPQASPIKTSGAS